MPELPEVEVTRRGLVDRITGAEISGVHVGKPLRWPLGCAPDSLVGRLVKGVRRRGKYLLIDLDRGLLLVHLGMSGSLAFDRQPGLAGPHDHFDLRTNQGTLRLHDPRRFGAVVCCVHEGDEWGQKLLGKLGPEPFGPDFTESGFLSGLRRRQSPVKQVLLGGELVVGVGNIYASEALFRAGIRPTVRSSRVSRSAAVRLYQAVKAVLAEAVSKGGSTLRDFVGSDGAPGHFQAGAMVYGREGLPCRVCATPIKLVRQGQRSSYYCPECQKS